jgi:hypothetical protein
MMQDLEKKIQLRRQIETIINTIEDALVQNKDAFSNEVIEEFKCALVSFNKIRNEVCCLGEPNITVVVTNNSPVAAHTNFTPVIESREEDAHEPKEAGRKLLKDMEELNDKGNDYINDFFRQELGGSNKSIKLISKTQMTADGNFVKDISTDFHDKLSEKANEEQGGGMKDEDGMWDYGDKARLEEEYDYVYKIEVDGETKEVSVRVLYSGEETQKVTPATRDNPRDVESTGKVNVEWTEVLIEDGEPVDFIAPDVVVLLDKRFNVNHEY